MRLFLGGLKSRHKASWGITRPEFLRMIAGRFPQQNILALFTTHNVQGL
ncbi:MAG: hypothetical protein OXC82_09455 [Rhodobacteraceae bacterium]|nr:hypothetical protein [Paracoccaceae bacterium]MCY4250641.1 hypothetical protein [Paracoccaceae bacterium]MCY4306760.1 hypothetical protein [Paracoccaceae bacterium]